MVALPTDQTCDFATPSIQPAKSSYKSWLNRALDYMRQHIVAAQNRHQTKALLYASDAELADIGLTRDDLYVIEKSGLFDDPSKELSRRASCRRNS